MRQSAPRSRVQVPLDAPDFHELQRQALAAGRSAGKHAAFLLHLALTAYGEPDQLPAAPEGR